MSYMSPVYVLDIFNKISESEIHKISILMNCCWLGNLCIEIIGAVKYVLKKRTSSSILKMMVCRVANIIIYLFSS